MPRAAAAIPRRAEPRKPIHVSIQEACHLLGISRVSLWHILEANQIESRYHGRRRLVVLASLEDYASNMPRERADTG
jgi:hypothetical protein